MQLLNMCTSSDHDYCSRLNPTLESGALPVQWSLSGSFVPSDLSINATTGTISWLDPAPIDSGGSVTLPVEIDIVAANDFGQVSNRAD